VKLGKNSATAQTGGMVKLAARSRERKQYVFKVVLGTVMNAVVMKILRLNTSFLLIGKRRKRG